MASSSEASIAQRQVLKQASVLFMPSVLLGLGLMPSVLFDSEKPQSGIGRFNVSLFTGNIATGCIRDNL